MTGDVHPALPAQFTGARSKEGPLTWGQRGMWLAMRRNPNGVFHLVRSVAVPSGAPDDPPSVVRAIGELVSRHESLRTLVRLVDGEPRQTVVRSGSLPVTLVETTPEKADGVLARISGEVDRTAYDRAAGFPLQAVLTVTGGRVHRVVLAFDHLAVDQAGMTVAIEELTGILAGAPPRPVELQPIDLAESQQTAGTTKTRTAVTRRVAQLRRIPPRMLTPVGPPHVPRTQMVLMNSPAMVAAGRMLAQRHRCSIASLVTAATATLVGVWGGHRTAALSVVVSNRFRPGLERMVSNLQSAGLYVLDLPDDATFDRLLALAYRSELAAYRFAYCDPQAMDRAVAEVNSQRGVEVNPFACFNAAIVTRRPEAVDLGEADLHALLPATRLRRQPTAQVRCHLCLHLDDPERNAYGVALGANTDLIPPEDIELFLRQLETYLVSSVFGRTTVGELRTWADRRRPCG